MMQAPDTLTEMPADTLPLYYKEYFRSTDTLKLTRYHSMRELAPGIEGTPIPYSPRTDDVMTLTLLICFFLSSIALARGKKFLLQQMKDFMLHRERTSIFDTSTASDVRYLLILTLQTCVLGGIVFFCHFQNIQPEFVHRLPSHLLLGIYTGSCLLYFLTKWLTYVFLGWTFIDKTRTTIWLESYSTLVYYLGFCLFPFVLFLIYFDLKEDYLVTIGLGMIIFTKLLMFYKWIKLFFIQISSLFLLILYFCALEIIPCLLLYRGLVEINNILLINL